MSTYSSDDKVDVVYLEKKNSTGVIHAENAAQFELSAIEETDTSKSAWLIAFAVSLGGFLFGYDTGYISSVLVTIGTDLGHELTSGESELVTSITSAGALIGSIFAGLSADRFGRKLAIYVGCALFIIGAVLQCAAFNLPQFVAGRCVIGFGVGSAAMIIPLYIGEIAPAKFRGRMIAFDNMSVTLGQLIAYGIGAGFSEVTYGWRYIIAIGAVPAIALCCLLPICPESPRQLIAHGKYEQAVHCLQRIYPNSTDEQCQQKVASIEFSIQEVSGAVSDKSLWWTFKQLHTVGSNFRALLTACAVMAISQLGGFNTLMYYSGTLFALVGFNKPVAVSIVVGGTNFLFTLFNMLVIDKFGRRIILLITVMGMAISMAVAAVAFHWIPITPELTLEATSTTWPGILVLVTIVFYVGFYASGVATIAWVGTELLPIEVRALGTMMNTVTCWSTNLVIASTFLSMMKGLTPSGAFGFYAGICGAGWVFILCFYPEVKGLPLEQIRDVYAHGFGVQYSKDLQKELKAQRKEAKIQEKSGAA